MKRYAIARYLTDEQKRRALAHEYLPTRPLKVRGEGASPVGYPRDADGYCPLARALSLPEPAPEALTIAHAIAPHSREQELVQETAIAFLDDWDLGYIPPDQLPAALGLEVPQ